MINKLEEYQEFTKTIAVYPKEEALPYLLSGLFSEAGEVAGVYKKYLRGDYDIEQFYLKLEDELGDIMWYFVELCNFMGWSVEDIIDKNIEKLSSRKKRNVLKGSGDSR